MKIRLYTSKPLNEKNQKIINHLQLDYDLTVVGDIPSEAFLIVDEGRLGLANRDWPKVSPVFVDFVSGAASHRRLYGGGKNQAVAKAVGLNKRNNLNVLDATTGLGRDAFVLASLGASVLMLERNPVVHMLLQDGLRRLASSEDEVLQTIAQRMHLHKGSFLDESCQITADVIYLDPMFPARTKSAKIKKDMVMFHAVVGHDDDADRLLPKALEYAQHRVAVKRPKGAPHLSYLKPTLTLDGKSNRFDIYTKQAL